MEKLKNYLFYGTLTKREWPLVRDAVWRGNRFILMTVSFSMFVMMTILAFYTVTFDHIYRDNALSYGIIAAIDMVLYIISKSESKATFRILPQLTFFFNLIMFCFGISLGTFLDPNSYALAFVIMIIVLPMLFCVRPIHSFFSVLFVDVIFLLISNSIKNEDIFNADVMNVVVWSIVGFFLNAITTSARVRNYFELYKNEVAQKEIRDSFKRVETQMDMFKSLGNICSSLYYIDLKTDSYIELVSYPEMKKLFGYSGGDAGRRMMDFCRTFVVDEYRQKMEEFLDLHSINHKLRNQNIISTQLVLEGMEREKREWCEVNLISVNRDENQNVVSVLFAVRTVHEQKIREMDQMERLQNALAAAESANKAKTVFLNNMSHDIRTPMNAITGFTGLAQKNLDNPELLRDYLDKISIANQHLLSLINDVLDMSRIESGKICINEKPESITTIINELSTILLDDVGSRKQSLNVDLQGLSDVNVLCDKLRLKQVLLNLLANAVKFTPDGGRIDLLVRETSSSAEVISYRMVVRDTGIGMSEEFLQKLFIPFEREMTSTVSGIQGTGLGMSITKNLVDMMGGKLFVKSTRNVGTEITLDLSFKVSSESRNSEGEAAPKKIVDMDLFRGKRFLLAEDNRMNQILVKHLLKDTGVELLIASNGREACDMVAQNEAGHFDLILMDVQMPIMDGYEATRRIRSMGDRNSAKIPIVALTADAFEEDRNFAISVGMNDHVSKPIVADVFFAVLQKMLEQKN